jgi:hypothetical protein
VKGTAVVLTSDPNFAPTALLHNLKHNKVLHEHNVVLTIETAQTPRVSLADRVRMETVSDKFAKVRLRFGFMESPNVPKALAIARKLGWHHVDLVLRVAKGAEAVGAVGHAEVAGSPVYWAVPVRQRRDRLFPDSDRAGGRGRHPGNYLKKATI